MVSTHNFFCLFIPVSICLSLTFTNPAVSFVSLVNNSTLLFIKLLILDHTSLTTSISFQNQESIRLFFSFKLRTFPRLDFFLLVVSQIFLKIKKLERNSKIIDRRLEREERDSTWRGNEKRLHHMFERVLKVIILTTKRRKVGS